MSLEKTAEKLRNAAEHAGKPDTSGGSNSKARHESEAETANVHAELSHSKHNKGQPTGNLE